MRCNQIRPVFEDLHFKESHILRPINLATGKMTKANSQGKEKVDY